MYRCHDISRDKLSDDPWTCHENLGNTIYDEGNVSIRRSVWNRCVLYNHDVLLHDNGFHTARKISRIRFTLAQAWLNLILSKKRCKSIRCVLHTLRHAFRSPVSSKAPATTLSFVRLETIWTKLEAECWWWVSLTHPWMECVLNDREHTSNRFVALFGSTQILNLFLTILFKARLIDRTGGGNGCLPSLSFYETE